MGRGEEDEGGRVRSLRAFLLKYRAHLWPFTKGSFVQIFGVVGDTGGGAHTRT